MQQELLNGTRTKVPLTEQLMDQEGVIKELSIETWLKGI